MHPKDLVNRLLEDDIDRGKFDEPRGDLTYEVIYPIGDEDLDLTVSYTTEKTTPGDSDFRPGSSRVKITDVIRDDTGESILKKLSQDQFYDLLDKVQDHHRSYR